MSRLAAATICRGLTLGQSRQEHAERSGRNERYWSGALPTKTIVLRQAGFALERSRTFHLIPWIVGLSDA
jgi:hypothetical protein